MVPSLLPMNNRPSQIVGCEYADVPLGIPNAHFNLSAGTFSAEIPAASAGWERGFASPTAHPFQDFDDFTGLAPAAQNPFISGRIAGPAAPKYRATALRSSAESAI